MTLAVGAAAVGLGLLAHVALAEPTPDPPPKSFLIAASSAYEPGCRDGIRAITYYRRAFTATRERMSLAGAVPRVWYLDCDVVRRRAVEWRTRAADARVAYTKWYEYNYDWRSWLPRNWYLVGSCESGYGGDPNWSHSNRQFTSAFGISWREYNRDAAYMGAPPWHVRHTPRDQYLAALGHYKRFGDGWGCPGP